jgi:hypothetical protein
LKVFREGLLFDKLSVPRHREKMMSNKKMIWIVVAVLVAVGVAGGLMAWAAPPDGKDGVAQAAGEPAASDSGGVAASVPVPASIPRAVPRNSMDGELTGTVIIEGGISYAMFQSGSRTRLVREGEEIASGVRLVQVRRNRIDVERNGVQEEIRLGWSEGARQQVRSGSIRGASTLNPRERLMEYWKERNRLRQELLEGLRG